MKAKIFTNAAIVAENTLFSGTLVSTGGTITDLGEGNCSRVEVGVERIDLEGDYLLPGLVELHTDNLEKHMQPRPGVLWPSAVAAMVAHDAQLVAAGITTVLDSVSCGELIPGKKRLQMLELSLAAIESARRLQMLKADHMLHLRCEVSDDRLMSILDAAFENKDISTLVRLMSIMDHTPGQRQFMDLDKFRQYYQNSGGWKTDEEFYATTASLKDRQKNVSSRQRLEVVELAHDYEITLASHDDTTEQQVEEARSVGVSISEFPTTSESARAAQKKGMLTILGAPNVVRGGSHSGNASAMDIARQGYMDILSSDYVPISLLHGAMRMYQEGVMGLPEAVSLVTSKPAGAVGLDDRGRIAPTLRADLLRVRFVDNVPIVRGVWICGEKVA